MIINSNTEFIVYINSNIYEQEHIPDNSLALDIDKTLVSGLLSSTGVDAPSLLLSRSSSCHCSSSSASGISAKGPVDIQ